MKGISPLHARTSLYGDAQRRRRMSIGAGRSGCLTQSAEAHRVTVVIKTLLN